MTFAAVMHGKYALGISIQEDFLERASSFRDSIGISKEKCEFRALSAYDLEKAGLPQFDQIVLFEVLEHLYHDELALELCAKRLKEDGWLHISVPNRDNHLNFEGVSRVETGAHVRHGYDYAMLESLLSKHGLEPLDRE
jgi:2-polyprenyl-3-methyl-5-hydroxy-6-metoxy-1,4-benzoquinol methylase